MSFPFFVRLPYCRGRFFSCSCEAVSSYMKTDICRIERLNFVFLLHQRNRGCEGSNVQKDIPVYIRHRCCCLFRRVPVRRFPIPMPPPTQDRIPPPTPLLDGIPTRTANSPERSYMPQVSIRVFNVRTIFLSRRRFPVVVEIPPFARRRPNSDNDLAFTLKEQSLK